MPHSKDKLKQFIHFIDQVANEAGNEWFKEELSKKYGSNNTNSKFLPDMVCSNVSEIHKYLMLDVVPIIDYSMIEDAIVQNQLYRDCIEMGKYRLGKINNTISFGEFCRYAHLQAEELINYFFNKKFATNIKEMVQFISEYKNGQKFERLPSHVQHIYYTVKLIAFKNFSSLNKSTFDDLFFLNEIRNELSHRNSFTIHQEEEDLKAFHKNGFSKQKIDWSRMSPQEKDLYNRGKYIITKRKEDYVPIYKSLEELKQSIIDCLSKPLQNSTTTSKPTLGDVNPILNKLKSKLESK